MILKKLVHTPNEVVHIKDIDAIIELLFQFIVKFKERIELKPAAK